MFFFVVKGTRPAHRTCAPGHLPAAAKPAQVSGLRAALTNDAARLPGICAGFAAANSRPGAWARCSPDAHCRTWGQARLRGLRRTRCQSPRASLQQIPDPVLVRCSGSIKKQTKRQKGALSNLNQFFTQNFPRALRRLSEFIGHLRSQTPQASWIAMLMAGAAPLQAISEIDFAPYGPS